ncbi:MAG: hypothetical protein ACE5JH_06830 [Acidobacteriota bacterium]
MRKASGVILAAVAVTSLLTGPSRPAPPGPAPPRRVPPPTVEPTLPVVPDLRLSEVQGDQRGGTARLTIDIDADPVVRDLELRLVLPRGLRAESGPFVAGRPVSIPGPAAPQLFSVPLLADHGGALPIRLEVAYLDAEGRPVRTRQGATLRLGLAAPGGRLHLGAYEVMGVRLEDLSR